VDRYSWNVSAKAVSAISFYGTERRRKKKRKKRTKRKRSRSGGEGAWGVVAPRPRFSNTKKELNYAEQAPDVEDEDRV